MVRKIVLNFHPFLFMVISLLFIFSEALVGTPPSDIIRPFFALSLLIIFLYPLAIKIAGGWEWGGILMSIAVLGLFFQPEHVLITCVPVGIAILLWYINHRLRSHPFAVAQVALLLTVCSFFIVTVQLGLAFFILQKVPSSYYKAMSMRSESNSAVALFPPSSSQKPDIYYIVLDSYSRTDVLRESFGYDNSEFINLLEGYGFIVPESAQSNYAKTATSISSTLDMQYWDAISPDMQNVVFWWPAKPVIQYSRVRYSLEAIGYKTVSFANDWSMTDNTTADMYFRLYPVHLSDYENYVAATTPLKALFTPFQEVAPLMSDEVHRRYIVSTFEGLKKVPHIKGPKFVFAHIISPHFPFSFNADGSPAASTGEFSLILSKMSKEEQRQGYIAQIKALNGLLIPVIDTILKESNIPPIIILQADHGYALNMHKPRKTAACLREDFSIFGAYYLPEKPRDVIPQKLTSVNLFRVIFNEYFGAQMPLLENRNYLTFGSSMFAGMVDVTDKIEPICP